jgi:hypothetical protein
VKLNELGTIYSSGNAFTTKAALLQSMYRVNKKEPSGLTTISVPDGLDTEGNPKKKKIRRAYGHIVEGGEEVNKNFYFDETFSYAQDRVKSKKPEETIKKDRMFNNLLSSMPLAFNLFHPLMMLMETNKNEVNDIVAALFPNYNVKEVKRIDIEFIPLPIANYTNDKSAMDAVIFFEDSSGNNNIISIEVKYTDSLGTNKAKDNELKIAAAVDTGYFTEKGIEFIGKGCSQIYRNFLLTEKYRIQEKLTNSYSVILAPEAHPTTESEINSLKKFLSTDCPENKVIKYSLEDFVRIISNHLIEEEYKKWISWFYDRYLDFDKVKSLYTELKGAMK